MALELVASPPETNEYNGKPTTIVTLSCMVASIGGIILGYDIGTAGGLTRMEPFLRVFLPAARSRTEQPAAGGYCRYDAWLLTVFISSLYVSGAPAAAAAAWVTREFGRRPAMVVGGAASLAGSVMAGAARNVWMLIMGRVLLGVGVGFANQAVPLYLSEMALPSCRGAIGNGFHLSTCVGYILANLVNLGTWRIKGWGWRISLALPAVPASFFTIGALFLPETPYTLIQFQRQDNIQKVVKTLQMIRGTSDVLTELNDIVDTATATAGVPIMRRRRQWPQLVMAIAIPFFQQATGFSLIAIYAPILFRTLGLGEKKAAFVSAIVLGVIWLGSTFLSMIAVDRIGRRALLILGGVQMLVAQAAIGSVMAVQLRNQDALSRNYACLVMALVCVYVAGYGWSWGPLGWLVPSEIFPPEIRSAGQSVAVAVSFLSSFVVAQTSVVMLCHLKAAGVFLCFAGWVALMTAFVFFFLPETRGVPIAQMGLVWGEHWFWGRMAGGGTGSGRQHRVII